MLTPKQAFPDDKRATALNYLIVLHQRIEQTLKGIALQPKDFATEAEWEVVEQEYLKANERVEAGTRALLAMTQKYSS
jgi:hypothetical protein